MRLRLSGRLYPDNPDLGHMPLWLLAYLGFLAMPWLVGPSPLPVWPTLLAIALFLPLYFRAWWQSGTPQLLHAIGIALIGFALLPYNWCAHTFVIYACAFAGLQQRAKVALGSVALMLLLFVALCRWLELSPVVDMVTVIVGMAAAAGNHIQQQQRRRQAILRLSQIEVENLARLAERERIGRDLHDLLGHTLSLIALKSDLARRLAERDPLRARQEIAEVERIAREGLAQVRSAVSGIRAAGLRTELARVRLMLEAADVALHADLSDEPLPVGVETTLAFVLREACTNIVRHARASKVEVRLQTTPLRAELSIHDDGRGGAETAVPGNGLRGLRERVEQLQGGVRLHSTRQSGTRIEVSIPLQPSSAPAIESSAGSRLSVLRS